MDTARLRAWWWQKQGLDGSLQGKSPREVLQRAGWARSVGGANPYLTLFARASTSKDRAESDYTAREICELPSARGCTYVLPKEDFALGIQVGYGQCGSTELATARKLGVPESEIRSLCKRTLEALADGPLDPKGVKDRVGDAVRNLGEEGKRKGLQTTLPVALGLLQREGRILRVPINGRLDSQRYAYGLWDDGPTKNHEPAPPTEADFTELARKYWRWIGPATLAHFQWFSGLGVGATKKAVESLGLVPIESGSELLIHPDELDAFARFQRPIEPSYALLSCLDSLVLHRRDIAAHVDVEDQGREVFGEKGMRHIGHLLDLPHNGIFDRGRLIGLWEYDSFDERIVWQSWVEPDAALHSAVARTESLIRDELGDARSFSLDSPESRRPAIESLKRDAVCAE